MNIFKNVIYTVRNTIFLLVSISLFIFTEIFLFIYAFFKYAKYSVSSICGIITFLTINNYLLYGKGFLKILIFIYILYTLIFVFLIIEDSKESMKSLIEDTIEKTTYMIDITCKDIMSKGNIYKGFNFMFYVSKVMFFLTSYICRGIFVIVTFPLIIGFINSKKYMYLINFKYTIPKILSVLIIIFIFSFVITVMLTCIQYSYYIKEFQNHIIMSYESREQRTIDIAKNIFNKKRYDKKIKRLNNEIIEICEKCNQLYLKTQNFKLYQLNFEENAKYVGEIKSLKARVSVIGKLESLDKMYEALKVELKKANSIYAEYKEFVCSLLKKYQLSNMEIRVMEMFSNCNDMESLKTTYKKLCKLYHPDNCGDSEEMKYINSTYNELCKKFE